MSTQKSPKYGLSKDQVIEAIEVMRRRAAQLSALYPSMNASINRYLTMRSKRNGDVLHGQHVDLLPEDHNLPPFVDDLYEGEAG